MINFSTVIDRVTRFEKALEQQLHKVQQDVDSDKQNRLAQQVKSERFKKFEMLFEAFREAFREAFSPEISLALKDANFGDAGTLESFEESLEELKEFEASVPEEQQKELGKVGLKVLESNIKFVEHLLDREIASYISRQTQKDLHELRNKAERMWRLTLITVPANEQEFEAMIMWASEQGEDIELATLQNLRNNLPYNSDKIQRLLDCAEERITVRLRKEAKSYRVFCSQKQLEQHFWGVQITKSEPDFTIISALSRTIAEVKLLFQVEQLELSQEPQPSGELVMNHNQDKVGRFKKAPSSDPENVQKEDIPKDATSTEAYAIAFIQAHQPNQAFYINQNYQLQTGIRHEHSQSLKDEFIQIVNPKELLQLEIVVWAEEMEIQPDWLQPYMFSRTKESPLAEFTLKPTQLGQKKIRVEFLYQRHWLAKIEFNVEVMEAPASIEAK